MDPPRTGDQWGQHPTVHLEKTLDEFYRRDENLLQVVYIPIFPSSRISIAPGIPANKKYILPEFPITKSDSGSTTAAADSEERLRWSLCVKRLTDFIQNMVFAVGPMTVALSNPCLTPTEDGLSRDYEKSKSHAHAEIQKCLGAFPPDRRPRVQWLADMEALYLQEKQVLASIMAIDTFATQLSILKPRVHYQLASKECLAQSGLKTPNSIIIRFDSLPPSVTECCGFCRSSDSKLVELHGCTGPRRRWLLEQIAHAQAIINEKPYPFVLKLTQSLGGEGTFIVRHAAERASTFDHLRNTYLPMHLPLLTAQNLDLGPMNIILQDFQDGPVFALSFYVNSKSHFNRQFQRGSFKFVCATTQVLSAQNHWQGSHIVYSKQDALEQRFRPTIERASEYLRANQYYGPAGIDVIDASCDESEANMWIVDVNVRMPSSWVLGSLREHFVSREMDQATLLLTKFKNLPRAEFRELTLADIMSGRIVIVAWFEYREGETLISATRLAVGGKDEKDLNYLVKRIQRFVK